MQMISITRILWCVCVALLFAPGHGINFDDMKTGEPPSGWTITMTHPGGAPKWTVIRDETAPSQPNLVAQASNDPTSSRFPLAIYDGADLVDGAIRVKFKAIDGKEDRAAGLVWRYQDADNYYLVRANALEDNVVLYKVENGKRSALDPIGMPKNYGVKHPVPSGLWCELSVRFSGSLFEVSFNGERLFQVKDTTFKTNGKVGLWTKADSVTYFDDFQVTPE
jgi:hypothetical protein